VTKRYFVTLVVILLVIATFFAGLELVNREIRKDLSEQEKKCVDAGGEVIYGQTQMYCISKDALIKVK
tara:strand:- start:1056 stop:1259 length:204 start_codon:yes stop_codon:yes gene_type:complete